MRFRRCHWRVVHPTRLTFFAIVFAMHGLLTAYGTFMGREQNQSQMVLEYLREPALGLDCDSQLWPVVLPTVDSLVASAVAIPMLRYWLALGEGAVDGPPKLETRAYNRFDLRHDEPSAGGGLLEGQLDAAAPSSLRAHWPAEQLQAALGQQGHEVELSDDPGSHCCNALLYWATLHAQKMQPRPWIGFLHLPRQPERLDQHAQLVKTALRWLDQQFV